MSFKIRRFQKVTSTNSLVRNLLKKQPGPLVVLATEQSGGRGQRGRQWYSPPGGLYFSLGIKPKTEIQNIHRLPVEVAGSLKKTIKKIYGLSVTIKKPNDLLIENKKIAGILVESATRRQMVGHLVIGIGLNLNVDFSGSDLAKTAASLKNFTRLKITGRKFLREFLKQFQTDFPGLFN